MAVYKVRMPTDHVGEYKVRMPTNHVGSYKVLIPFDAPVPTTVEISINMAGAPAGASWSLRDSGNTVVATGTASTSPVTYPAGTYTLIWEDTVFEYEPPAPEVQAIEAGTSHTFGPP